MSRKAYPSDLSQEQWEFVAPYLTLMKEDAPQHDHSFREVFNALRWLARAGAPWRLLPHDFPPWPAVYQQFRRWIEAGCFEALMSHMRFIIHTAQGRTGQPSAVILDGRTLQSSCESGLRAGYDGYKRRKGSKVHMAVDTLDHLIDLTVTPANEQELAQVKQLCVKQCKRLPARRCRWRGPTKATRAKTPSTMQRPQASSCRWSSCPKRRSASCSCRGAGW